MPAAKFDLVVEQGATYRRTIEYQNPDGTPYPLTGFGARMQIRATYADQDALLSLTDNNGLTIDGPAGTIAIVISATDTATLPRGNQVYDLEIISSSGEVDRLLSGLVIVSPEATR